MEHSFALYQAVFEVNAESGLTLIEIADGITVQDVIDNTGCSFTVSDNLKPMGQITV